MEAMQPSLRAAWNWMVSRVEIVLQAKEAKAIREGLMPPMVAKPDYNGLNPAESRAIREQYIALSSERRQKIFDLPIPMQWRPNLSGKDSEAERLGYKQDYQVINWHLKCIGLPKLPKAAVQTLLMNYFKKSHRRKKYRRALDTMPLQVKTGPRLRLRHPSDEDNWLQRRCNAEVHLPFVGWIAVKVDNGSLNKLLTPGNTTREGCAILCEYGRWSAVVNTIRKEQVHAYPCDNSVVGIDPGLATLATTSDYDVLPNHRDLKYAEAREVALSVTDSLPEGDQRTTLKIAIFRQDARQRRKTLTQCRQFAAKLSKKYHFIAIEANYGIALGIGSRYVGATKTLIACLTSRCGAGRVLEVQSSHNSQDCSACEHRDKEAWDRKLGCLSQMCKCLSCGLVLDRDVNAARNIKRRAEKLLNLGSS